MSKTLWTVAGIAGVLVLALGVQVTSLQLLSTKVVQDSPSTQQSEEAQQVRGQVANAPTKQKVLIGFKNPPNQAERALVENHGGQVKHSYRLVNAIAAELPEPAIAALQKDSRVTVVEPDIEVTIVDQELDDTWGVKAVLAGEVHDSGNKGTGVKVAVIDTGIDYTHPDLAGNYVGGYDFYNNDNDPKDDNSHGTHVAGTIAALDNEVGVVGMAPEAQLYALKVAGSNGSGSFSAIIAALDWAVDNGIQVVNISMGAPSYPGSVVEAAFNNAYQAGIVNVSSAGNSGSGTDTVGYPAKFDSVIAVAALTSGGSRASYSSTGPDVELSAPGSGIRSTVLNGGYGNKSGTSMASPHVAGLAALAIRAGITTPAAVRQAMISTAQDLGVDGRDNLYGYGRIDAPAAVAAVGTINFDPTVAIIQPPNGAIFDSGTVITFTGTANDQEDGNLSDSIVWASSIDSLLGNGSSITTNGLSEGTHTITATAVDSGGRVGNASIDVIISTNAPDTESPTAPIGLTASERTKGKNTTVDLSWGASTDNIAVDKYQILRDGQQVAESSSTSYNDRDVQQDGTYTYVVRALDAAGNVSPNSNEATVSLTGNGGGSGGGGDGGGSGGGGNHPCEPWPSCRK